MLTYIPVSFLFSFKKVRVSVIFLNRVRVRVSFRVRVRVRLGFEFGIGNLIGGAVGTFGSSVARRLLNIHLTASYNRHNRSCDG